MPSSGSTRGHTRTRSLRIAWLFLATVEMGACGRDGPAATSDAGDVPAAFVEFASSVRDAMASCHDRNCAVALPAWPVASGDEIARATIRYVSSVVGLDESALAAERLGCDMPFLADCDTRFQHDIMEFTLSTPDECRALPLSGFGQAIEGSAAEVSELLIARSELGGSLALALAGRREGRLFGLIAFAGRATCGP